MSKQFRKEFRFDLLTSELISALITKLSIDTKKVNESELIRSAIYRMAKDELTGNQFEMVVQLALDKDNL